MDASTVLVTHANFVLEIFCLEIIWRVCFKALSNKVRTIGTCFSKCLSYCNRAILAHISTLE